MRESEYLEAQAQLVQKLSALPFFSAMERKYLKDLIGRSKMRTYAPNEIITRQGTFDKWFYIMLGGEVAIIKDDKEIARLSHTGDTFGEMALIDGKARSASVMSVADTACLAIDASFLNEVNREHYLSFYVVFYQIVAEVLSRRLRETNEELVRVQSELESIKRYYGQS